MFPTLESTLELCCTGIILIILMHIQILRFKRRCNLVQSGFGSWEFFAQIFVMFSFCANYSELYLTQWRAQDFGIRKRTSTRRIFHTAGANITYCNKHFILFKRTGEFAYLLCTRLGYCLLKDESSSSRNYQNYFLWFLCKIPGRKSIKLKVRIFSTSLLTKMPEDKSECLFCGNV